MVVGYATEQVDAVGELVFIYEWKEGFTYIVCLPPEEHEMDVAESGIEEGLDG
jgi:hypothetical protein